MRTRKETAQAVSSQLSFFEVDEPEEIILPDPDDVLEEDPDGEDLPKDLPDNQTVEVHPSRLEWGGEGVKEGDIARSYSADKIADYKGKSTIRTPFKHAGGLWVSVGGGPGLVQEAYRLVPLDKFKGETSTYNSRCNLKGPYKYEGDGARYDPLGFYHSVLVSHRKQQYVLVGPPADFIPRGHAKKEEKPQ